MMPSIEIHYRHSRKHESMTVTHVGSNQRYASNWEHIFAKGAKRKPTGQAAAKSTKKKSGTKPGKK